MPVRMLKFCSRLWVATQRKGPTKSWENWLICSTRRVSLTCIAIPDQANAFNKCQSNTADDEAEGVELGNAKPNKSRMSQSLKHAKS